MYFSMCVGLRLLELYIVTSPDVVSLGSQSGLEYVNVVWIRCLAMYTIFCANWDIYLVSRELVTVISPVDS